MKYKKTIKKLVLLLSFALITIAYQNCGSSGGGGSSVSSSTSGADNEIVPLPNTKTASVLRGSRVLDSLVSCLGTGEPSNNSKAEWQKNLGTLSEEGLANTLTQPMAKSLAVVSSEVCNDLVQKERNPASQRIFAGIDFTGGGVTPTQITTVTKRLARSCWGRNPTSDEIDMILNNVTQSFFGSTENGQTTINKMVYLCTAMAASFASYEM